MSKTVHRFLLPSPVQRHLPLVWLLALLWAVIGYSSASPPAAWALGLLGCSGLAIATATDRATLILLWRRSTWLWAAWALVGVGATFSEWRASAGNYTHFIQTLSPQAGLVWCLPALSVFMVDTKLRSWTTLVLAALCVWHAVTIPIEAITGIRFGWLTYEVVVRSFGWLTYQSAGLSSHPYLFAGFYLPIFYLVWGSCRSHILAYSVKEKNVWAWRCYLLLPWAWLVIAACLQSRSAFVGALMASCLCSLLAQSPRHIHGSILSGTQTSVLSSGLNKKRWVVMALGIVAMAAVAAVTYWFLNLGNKTGLGLRAAYWQVYLDAAFQWPQLLTGHGFLNDRRHLAVEGLPYIWHSHNDWLEIVYSWGLITWIPYLVFMIALAQLLVQRCREGQPWLLAAAFCVLPTMVTDLGLQHYEKAALMTLLAALMLAGTTNGLGHKRISKEPK